MNKFIQAIEQRQMTRTVPDFGPGDTVVVEVKVKEGDRERVQAYEGVVIAKSNRGLNSTFTVRKISHGEGVERVFQVYSPSIGGMWERLPVAMMGFGSAVDTGGLAAARCFAFCSLPRATVCF